MGSASGHGGTTANWPWRQYRRFVVWGIIAAVPTHVSLPWPTDFHATH